MFISGIGSSIFLIDPVYVSEFSNESIRGTLTSGALVFLRLGMLTSYLIGGALSYKSMVYICLTLSVIGIMILIPLKESPTLLMMKGMEEEARKSIAFYTNSKSDSIVVLQEIKKIKKTLAPKKLEKSKSTQRALFLSLTLMTTAVFQGIVVVMVYANPLFSEAVPENILSAAWCSVILAVVSVTFGMIAASLTDLIGRRSLMIIFSVAAGLCCICLGTHIHLHWGPPWLTAVFVYLFVATYQCGAGTVPYILIAELFLPEVKSIMSMIVLEWTWLCSFIILYIFTPLVAAIGLGPVFYIFATYDLRRKEESMQRLTPEQLQGAIYYQRTQSVHAGETQMMDLNC
ncbi:unnamed protein product [Diatraea saccharalis]|uniref:Uncharacterized protein n=1 Tax=Diatraea saccharalis TaxID=40085 RepID=A0A9N9RAC1_9NEOP|nr:unnamed protein product [Diatraea saccharalis]